MQKKILVIGSINKDLIVRVQSFPKDGQTILGESFLTGNGGKGANQASAIAKLGGCVSMLGALGDDMFGKDLLQSLQEVGVDTNAILIKKNVSSGMAIVTIDKNGSNNIVVIQGANALIENKDLNENFMMNFDLIIVQLEIPLDFVIHATKMAKRLNKQVILNPSPAIRLDRDFLSCVDILIPNENEIEIIGGIQHILECGVKYIVLTLGDNGCKLITKQDNKIYEKHFKSYKVKAIDTTAAGDSFLGGLAFSIARGQNIEHAIEFANKVAAISVTRIGAISSMPSYDEVQKL